MPYYTLLERDPRIQPTGWYPQFGDYDRKAVVFEMDEYRRAASLVSASRRPHYTIVRTETAGLDDVTAAIARLNAGASQS